MNHPISPVSHFVCGDPPPNGQPAIDWKAGDESALLSILQKLASLHRLPDAVQGNITERSFYRDKRGQLLLYCGQDKPSQCEKTQLNDREARLYVHAAAQPELVDDLTAIGVVLAEWLVGHKNLPGVDDGMKRYRRQLAEKLKNVRRAKRLSQPCRKLIVSLLLADEYEFKNAGDCLGQQSALATWSTDGNLRFASVRKFLITHAWVPLTSLAVVLALLMASWHYWSAAHDAGIALERSEDLNTELQGKLDQAKTDNGALQKNEESLTEQLARSEEKLRKCIGSDEPTTPKWLNDDPRYLTFKGDSYLTDDREFQELARKEMWTHEEGRQVDQKLSTINDAREVWWDAVDNSLSLAESTRLFDGKPEAVVKILKSWLSAVTKPHEYIVTIQCSVPASYNGYSMRMTLVNLGNAKSIPVVSTAESQRAFYDERLKMAWKAGQSLEIWLETFSYWNAMYNDEFSKSYAGAFSLYRLQNVVLTKGDLKLRISVAGLPGPPKRLKQPDTEEPEPPKEPGPPEDPGGLIIIDPGNELQEGAIP